MAIKRILDVRSPEKDGASLLHESELMAYSALSASLKHLMSRSKLRHPNIIRYYGSALSGDTLFIVTEYAEVGSLKNVFLVLSVCLFLFVFVCLLFVY